MNTILTIGTFTIALLSFTEVFTPILGASTSLEIQNTYDGYPWLVNQECGADAFKQYQHYDDKGNCVCDGTIANKACSSDADCCDGQGCSSAGVCNCFASGSWWKVESSCSNCCSKKCAYWNYYSATYCT